MRILVIHNYHQWLSGDDLCVEAEVELLKKKGHDVIYSLKHNKEIKKYSLWEKISLFMDSPWSEASKKEIKGLAHKFRPEVVHVHGFSPLWTPSIFAAAQEYGSAVVLTMHGFNLICLNGYLLRNNRICIKCLGKIPWRGILYRCYRKSMIASLGAARILWINRNRKTWEKCIDGYIVVSKHAQEVFMQAGIQREKLFVKSNYATDFGQTDCVNNFNSAIFIGHLETIKGVNVLINAWKGLPYKLKIVGNGSLLSRYKLSAYTNIEYLGELKREGIYSEIAKSAFLIVPSLSYETGPQVVLEAFSVGRPVLASKLPAMTERIEEGETGLLFEPANPEDLRKKVIFLMQNQALARRMGSRARREFELKYTAEVNYERLMNIYSSIRTAKSTKENADDPYKSISIMHD